MRALQGCMIVGCVASALPAQIGSVAAGAATYELLEIPATSTTDAARVRFSADPTLSTVLHSFWWYYRVQGDSMEFALNESGGQLVSRQFSGNRGILRWDDVDGRGISAIYIVTVHATGPAAGQLVHHVTFRNNSGAPLTLNVFAYSDIDACATPVDDTVSGSVDRHAVVDATCASSSV